jgi:hypothetical protein
VSVQRYSMGNRDLVLVLDDDPQRCAGLNARYATRCRRRSITHPTQLCATHRDQSYCCRACKDGNCNTHALTKASP